MNEEKAAALINDFPKVFRKLKHFECSGGWEPIIREACEKFFGLNCKDVLHLFTPDGYEECDHNIKPKLVAKQIRKFLETHQ